MGRFQEPAEADGPAHDAAQDVAPAFVGGQHPVGDQKGGGPGMVGNDPEGHVLRFSGAIGLPGQVFDAGDDGRSRSVSKLVVTPWMTAARRSRPMPVSMLGLGRGLRTPSACG